MGLRDWNLLLNVTMKQQDTCMKKVALRLREQERNQCSSTAPLLMNFIWQKFYKKEKPDAETSKAPTPGFTQPISSST